MLTSVAHAGPPMATASSAAQLQMTARIAIS
jgi:hypothetical protein